MGETMKKQVLIILIVSVMLVLAACTKTVQEAGSDAKKVSAAGPQAGAGKVGNRLRDLVKAGAKYKCESVIKTSDGTLSNVIYTDRLTTRGEIKVSTDPGTVILVSKREGAKYCSYMWTIGDTPKSAEDPVNQAVKVCFDYTEGIETGSRAEATKAKISTVNWDGEASCTSYTGIIDTTVPAGYELVDLTDSIKAVSGESAEY